MEAQLVYTTSKFEKRRFFEVPFLPPRPLPKIAPEIYDNARDYFRTKIFNSTIKKFNNKLIVTKDHIQQQKEGNSIKAGGL